jgi:hypothetical protein
VDLENAWFEILVAAGTAEGAVTKERVPYSPRKATPKTPVWKIDDEKRLLESLALIHQLARKSRMTFYQDVLPWERLALFPPRQDFVSQIPPTVYAASQTAPGIKLRKLMDVLAAGPQRCVAAGDVEGFRQIIGDWRVLTRHLTDMDLRPSRYADHAMLERLFAWAAWLLGGCVGLAALSRFRHNPLAWGLSARIQDLIRPLDWLAMIAGGLVFPMLWYGAITRLAPLAAREWNAAMSGFIMPGGQFGCLLLSMLFGRGPQALRRATLARIVPTVWICGMLALAGLSLYFYSQERHWIQQDRIFGPHPFQYKSTVAQVLRAELLEMPGEPAEVR